MSRFYFQKKLSQQVSCVLRLCISICLYRIVVERKLFERVRCACEKVITNNWKALQVERVRKRFYVEWIKRYSAWTFWDVIKCGLYWMHFNNDIITTGHRSLKINFLCEITYNSIKLEGMNPKNELKLMRLDYWLLLGISISSNFLTNWCIELSQPQKSSHEWW